jgi:integrase
LELLKARAKVRKIDIDLIFPSILHPQKPIDLRRPWLEARLRSKISNGMMRHFYASYLAMDGATPSELAAVLGHRTLQMVMRNSHLSEQHTVNVLEWLNQKLFGV